MIVSKFWITKKHDNSYTYTKTWSGIFLFGFIPLYIRLDMIDRTAKQG